MAEIVINEWKKFGHHRGYAEALDGSMLGYVDAKTGEVVLEPGVPPEPLTSQLRTWAAARRAPAPTAIELPNPVEPQPVLQDTAWEDLAANRPGDHARAKAAEAWAVDREINPALAVAARVLNVHTPERAWRKGAEGEERVGALLDSLAKHGWRTLHSIEVGTRGDIDHLSIGPGGVVLFNTKHHHGAKFSVSSAGIYVNGARTEYVAEVKDQARRAYERLAAAGASVPFVTPWIVLVNGGLLQPEAKIGPSPKGVKVSTNHNLKTNVRRLDHTLDAESVDAIYDVARRSTTWR